MSLMRLMNKPKPLNSRPIPAFGCLGTASRLLAILWMVMSLLTHAAKPATPLPSTPLVVPAQADQRDIITFRGGDLLFGLLDSMEAPDRVFWRHPDVQEPIPFKLESVAELKLRAAVPPAAAPAPTCLVRLNNGDEFNGRLGEFGASTITLDTWYAGTLTIPKKFIRLVVPRQLSEAPLYAGPTGVDGWTIGKVNANIEAGEWKYRNGSFLATKAASIARNVRLPEVAILEFDLSWRGLFDLAVALYTDQLEPINLLSKETGPDFAGFYSLRLNNYIANLMPVTKPDPIRYLGQTQIHRFLDQKQSVHVELRMNKPKATVGLLIDGVLATNWLDPQGFVGRGTGIRIVHQGQGSSRISRIVVRSWDGQFDEPPTNPPDSLTDLVKLRNEDRVAGKVDWIREGKLGLTLGERKLEIPLNRVKQVELAGAGAERLPFSRDSVRAYFQDGGSAVFQIEKFDGNKFTARAPGFSAAMIDRAAFSRIEFTPPEIIPAGASNRPPSGGGFLIIE